MLEQPTGEETILQLTKLLPLLAAWEPAEFATECLQSSIDFLVNSETWDHVRGNLLQGEGGVTPAAKKPRVKLC